MLRVLKSYFLISSLVFFQANSMAREIETAHRNTGVERTSERVAKEFSESYNDFALQCLDAEGSNIAPKVFVDDKLERCKIMAESLEHEFEILKEEGDEFADMAMTITQCTKSRGFENVEDFIMSVSNVSSQMSCREEEKEMDCVEDLTCNGVRSMRKFVSNYSSWLAKGYDKAADYAAEKGVIPSSCMDNSQGNCLDEIMSAFIANLAGTADSISALGGKIWDFLTQDDIFDGIANTLHTGATSSVKSIESFWDNPVKWVIDKAVSFFDNTKTWMKSELFCQKWEGEPHRGKCLEPLESLDCLDCNDLTNAVCASTGAIISEVGVVVLTGGAGTIAGVSAKLGVKAMSSLSARAVARVERAVPSVKILSRAKDATTDAIARKKAKALSKKVMAAKLLASKKAKKMADSFALFSEEKYPGLVAAAKQAKRAKEVATKVAGLPGEVLDKAYDAGAVGAKKLIEKASGGKVQLESGTGKYAAVVTAEDGSKSIVVDTSIHEKGTKPASRAVAVKSVKSSVGDTAAEIKKDSLSHQISSNTSGHGQVKIDTSSSSSHQSAPKQSEKKVEVASNDNKHSQSEHHNKEKEEEGGSSVSLKDGYKVVGTRGIGTNTPVGSGGPNPVISRKGVLTAAVAVDSAVKFNRSVEEVDTNTRAAQLEKEFKSKRYGQKQQIIDSVVDDFIKKSATNTKISDFSKKGVGIGKAKEILRIDDSQPMSQEKIQEHIKAQEQVYSYQNKRNFINQFSEKTGASKVKAAQVFETKKKEFNEAKKYLNKYSKDLTRSISSAIATSTSKSVAPREAYNPVNDVRRRELERKLASLESDISYEKGVMDSLASKNSSSSAIPMGAPTVKPVSVIPSSMPVRVSSTATTSSSSRIASRSPASVAVSSGSSVASIPAPTTSSAVVAASSNEDYFIDAKSETSKTDAKAPRDDESVANDGEEQVIAVTSSNEEERPAQSRARALDSLLDIEQFNNIKISENTTLPWSLSDILGKEGSSEDKRYVTSLITNRTVVRKMEVIDGEAFDLHTLTLEDGQVVFIKKTDDSMEIVESHEADSLRAALLEK